MDSLQEDSFYLEEQLNKCRCCLRTLIDEENSIEINKNIQNNFFDLTGLKLLDTPLLSNVICPLCSKDLTVFSQFRKDICKKQKKLYQALLEHDPDIMIENDQFQTTTEDTEGFISCDIKTENEIAIEDVQIEALDECIDYLVHPEKSSGKFNNEEVDDQKLHQCDICSFQSNSVTEISSHMTRNHINSSPNGKLSCEFCSQKFEKRHLLNRHIRVKHTKKERKFQCKICQKTFFNTSTLKKHEESHGQKNMPCEFCGKLFTCMNNLRTHLYYHSEPKFVCDYEGCGKKFFMRKLLRAHLNTHIGQKDFSCEYCEKSYFFQNHLKRHIRSTHLKLKINCEVPQCTSSFARKETYRKHVLQHHADMGTEYVENLLKKIRELKVEDGRDDLSV